MKRIISIKQKVEVLFLLCEGVEFCVSPFVLKLFFNPFLINLPFLEPWKREKTSRVFTFSEGYQNGILEWNGLIKKELGQLTPFYDAAKKC